MEKLKPCPFCGGEPEMINYSEHEWLVNCPACCGMVERWRETEKEAAEQWNRRAKVEQSVGVSEKVEQLVEV